MLVASKIHYAIDKKKILKNVSVSVRTGEMIGVVGPNGAGKSTLLRILAGDAEPTSGAVSLMNRPLISWDRRELAKRRGVLMQKSSLAFGFSVFEVVLMGRIPFNTGAESAEDLEIAYQTLVQVGLEKFADRLYPTLSGGEQQRVQLARILTQIWQPAADDALETSARYLLLDEPTASLDLAYQQQTLTIAKELAGTNTAVLAILHDLNLASQFADTVVMLKGGRVAAQGRPAEVLTSVAIEDLYDTSVIVLPHPKTGRPLITV